MTVGHVNAFLTKADALLPAANKEMHLSELLLLNNY